MNVGILMITYGNIGAVILQAATRVMGVCPLTTLTLSASEDCDPDRVFLEAQNSLRKLDHGDGVLVLTDLYGSTPGNIACRLQQQHNVPVVAGLNLPMLVRLLNYPNLPLDELVEKATSGGRDGVQQCMAGNTMTHAK